MKFNGLPVLPLFLIFSVSSALAAKPPKDIISSDRATSIALKESPGEVTSHELEYEMKQWVYSFDIHGNDSQTHEVLLNARTGKIVSNKIETPAESAAEAKADQANRQRTQ